MLSQSMVRTCVEGFDRPRASRSAVEVCHYIGRLASTQAIPCFDELPAVYVVSACVCCVVMVLRTVAGRELKNVLASCVASWLIP
jgi:hypothetical protein